MLIVTWEKVSTYKNPVHASTFDFIHKQNYTSYLFHHSLYKKNQPQNQTQEHRRSQSCVSLGILVTVYNKDLQDSLE